MSGHRTAYPGAKVVSSPTVRRLAAVVVLGFLVWRLGVDQSLRAVGAIDLRTVAAAFVLTAVTTLCCAWRWSTVATAIGARVPLGAAVAACYRSQFLNTATPGGVLGDVHRGVQHGRHTGDAGRGLRSVVWERTAGQVVQATMALAVLSVLPSPLRPAVPWVWSALAVSLAVALLVTGLVRAGRLRRPTPRLRHRQLGVSWAKEVRRGVLARGIWPQVALASGLAVGGHVATFLVAAHTAGSRAPATRLVPLAFVVLLAMGLPTTLAGWGPREGAAAWVFGAAGLGGEEGLATAVVYGVLVLLASLPGGVLLLVAHRGGRPRVRTEEVAHA